MDSVPRDLRDALSEDYPEENRASAAALITSARSAMCWKCRSLPAPGSKLRYCGRCETATYCSKACARAHWPKHKLECENLCKDHGEALEGYVAQGGRTKDFNQQVRNARSWFAKVPGLNNEIELMAWRHRSQNPLIIASSSESDTDGSGIRVLMMPRSFWDEDPRFLDHFTNAQRESLRDVYDESSFCANTRYVYVFHKQFQGKPSSTFQVNGFFEANGAVQAAEIVDALTAATRLEDLADAFAWYEAALPAQVAQVMLDCIRQRTTLVHGCTIPQGSIPDSTRAINTEVALMMFDAVKLAFDIRLKRERCISSLKRCIYRLFFSKTEQRYL